jgi:hypothetical protein
MPPNEHPIFKEVITKFRDGEHQTRWLESHPETSLRDYFDAYSADSPQFRSDRTTWQSEFNLAHDRGAVDRDLINQVFAKEGVPKFDAAHTDHALLYMDLKVAFSKHVFDKAYKDFMPDLVSHAMAEVRREPRRLDSFVTVVSLAANDAAARKAGIPPDHYPNWATSELGKAIEGLTHPLREWGKAMADDSPKAAVLKDLAQKCRDQLKTCVDEHTRLSNQAEFVEHGVPANLHAVGELIAAQLASRIGPPSFAGLVERVAEIPRQTDKAQIKESLDDVFHTKTSNIIKELAQSDSAKAKALAKALDPGDSIKNRLKEWSDIRGKTTDPKALNSIATALVPRLIDARSVIEGTFSGQNPYKTRLLSAVDGIVCQVQNDAMNAFKLLG